MKNSNNFLALLMTTVMLTPAIAFSQGIAELGRGFDRLNDDKIMNMCLNHDGNHRIVYTPRGSAVTSQSASRERISEFLEAEASLSGKHPKFSASASASFLNATQETSHSITFYSMIQIESFRRVFEPNPNNDTEGVEELLAKSRGAGNLNNVGVGHLLAGDDVFATFCGDSYLDSITYGGSLVYALTLNFSSKDAKMAFGAKVNAAGPADIVAFEASVNAERNTNKSSVTIDMNAIQIGGNPALLGKLSQGMKCDLVPDELIEKGEEDEEGNSSNTLAKDTGKVPCDELFDAINKYGSKFHTQFPSVTTEDQTGMERYAPIKMTSQRYASLGIITIPPPVSRELQDARNNILTKFDETQEFYNRVSDIVAAPLSPEFKNDFLSLERIVKENLDALRRAGLACYEDGQNCVETAKIAIDNLLPISKRHEELLAADLRTIRLRFHNETEPAFPIGIMEAGFRAARAGSTSKQKIEKVTIFPTKGIANNLRRNMFFLTNTLNSTLVYLDVINERNGDEYHCPFGNSSEFFQLGGGINIWDHLVFRQWPVGNTLQLRIQAYDHPLIRINCQKK